MKLQSIFTSLNISASGLTAQRKKLDAVASNIANVNTTKTDQGEPYRRKITTMEAEDLPDFEVVFQKKRLALQTNRKEHFPFNKNAKVISNNNYKSVNAVIQEDQSGFLRVYDPSHPDADADGYVSKPNVNVVSEMVDMISASRAYEANLSSIDAVKQMAQQALNI